MDVITGIITEEEAKSLSEKAWSALVPLATDAVANMLQNYISDESSDREVVEKIKATFEGILNDESMYVELKSLGIPDLLRQMNFEEISEKQGQYVVDLIEKLELLEKYEPNIKATIEPRKPKDFNNFLSTISSNPVLKEKVRVNKIFFCSPREKVRYTGLGIAITRADTWKIALQGLRYIQYCEKHAITEIYRREF